MPDPFAPGLLQRLPGPVRKVAVVRASRIGDFVCATPALRALAAALPEAEITMITLRQCQDLAERLPFIRRFVPFPGFPGLAEQFFDARQALRFFDRMQAEEFDLAVQMQGSGVYSNPFTLMLGARATAGFVRQGDGAGRLDAALPIPLEGHEIERVLALATFLGASPRGTATVFPLRTEDHAAAQALLADAPRPIIALHPGARDASRRWALDRFAAVGAALRRRHGGTAVVVGGVDERPAAEMIAQSVGEPYLNLAGRIPLAVFAAVLTRLAVLVTNDSGPAHIGYALRTPTVTIFGAGDPTRYGPPALGPFRILVHDCLCRVRDYADCPIGRPCLQSVTVAEVLDAAEAVFLHDRRTG
jgi:ADP-heptose:LPS heptosyltransferase